MSDEDRLRALSRALLRPGEPVPPEAAGPYSPQAAGTLTPALISRALDELWHKRYPLPPGGYSGARKPYGAVPAEFRDPEWTVEAGGYRLVIKGGAIVGLERKP